MTTKRTDGITILIPNWNHRNYLARSVGSAVRAARLLAREGIGCEVLVVDDQSRDGSQRLLAAMAMMDPTGSVDAVLSPVNRGLGGTRNHGMERARYRWVLCMDADNEVTPANVAAFYRSAKETGAALVYGNLIHHAVGGAVTGLFSNDLVHEGILAANYVDAMAVVDADQVLAAGGYSSHPDARAHEDWELILHLIADGREVVFVPLLLGIYHVLDLSMVKQTSFDHSRVRRMFDQRQVGLPAGFRSRVYHPELGYLI